MKRLITGIFISLLAFFLMSHNAFAAEIVNDQVSLYATFSAMLFNCYPSSSISTNNSGTCHTGGNNEITEVGIIPSGGITLDSGSYYVEIYLRIANNASTINPQWYGAGNGQNLQFISEEQVSSTTANSITYRTYRLLFKYVSNNLTINYTNPIGIGGAGGGGIFAAEGYKPTALVFWRTNSADQASIVQAINAQNQYLQDISQNLYIADGHLNNIEDYLEIIKDNIDDLQQAVEDDNQAEQDAVDNIDNQSPSDIDSGDNSSATNLIGNIGNIFTQIQNIPASSTCSVAADFGNLDLGNINFCSGKENLPFVVSFGAYVFEFVFVVGCSIIIVKRVLSLYDWSRR